jgi:hypothetical protein
VIVIRVYSCIDITIFNSALKSSPKSETLSKFDLMKSQYIRVRRDDPPHQPQTHTRPTHNCCVELPFHVASSSRLFTSSAALRNRCTVVPPLLGALLRPAPPLSPSSRLQSIHARMLRSRALTHRLGGGRRTPLDDCCSSVFLSVPAALMRDCDTYMYIACKRPYTQ